MISYNTDWDEILFDNQYNNELLKQVLEWDWTNILPKQNNVLRALNYFSPEETKVIVLGQDPYSNPDNACGLAFGTDTGFVPMSLRNVFKEVKSDLGSMTQQNGNLEPWVEQGVLLLNKILTVNEGQSKSHENKGWEQFTANIIKDVVNLRLNASKPIVIMAWGSDAKNHITNALQHLKNDNLLILEAGHPSPLNTSQSSPFSGCKHFSKCNDFLAKHHESVITW